jgi:hypothetical protein
MMRCDVRWLGLAYGPVAHFRRLARQMEAKKKGKNNTDFTD